MIAALLLAFLPCDTMSHVVRVDSIERNLVVDRHNRPSLDQYILKRFGRHEGVPGFYISEWLMASGERYRRGDGTYEIRLWRGAQEIRIVTRSYRETLTKFDPELRDRERLPIDQRRPHLTEVCE